MYRRSHQLLISIIFLWFV